MFSINFLGPALVLPMFNVNFVKNQRTALIFLHMIFYHIWIDFGV